MSDATSNMTQEEWDARVAAEETWESSPAGVRYSLGAGPIMLGVSHESIDTQITLTVAALPQEVREFVYEDCFFATVGAGISGQVLPRAIDRWLILLDAAMLNDYDEDECRGVIAHEIAHAYLGHVMNDPSLTIECEREAGAQAAAWGFTGIGADPEHRFRSTQVEETEL